MQETYVGPAFSARPRLAGVPPYLRFHAASGAWRLAGHHLDPDGVWMVDTLTFGHGWAAWRSRRLMHVRYTWLNQPLPPRETLPGEGWQVLRGFELTCLTGPDQGLRARYQTSTVGGREAVGTLADEIADQSEIADANTDADYADAAVWLRSERPRRRGPYNPRFEVIAWADRSFRDWREARERGL